MLIDLLLCNFILWMPNYMSLFINHDYLINLSFSAITDISISFVIEKNTFDNNIYGHYLKSKLLTWELLFFELTLTGKYVFSLKNKWKWFKINS